MRGTILNFPKQFAIGLKAAEKIKLKQRFKNVVVSGMGGSAWPTDILNCWLDLENPIIVNRTYKLPKWASKQTLCIFSSYSGNTEECLSSYKEAIRKKIPTAAVTSGGELKNLCEKNNTPLAIVPSGFQPRMATGYMFSALYSILANSGIIKNRTKEILQIVKKLKPKKIEQKGKQIAKKLKGKIPIIYTPDKFKILGYVWKIKFNENSKTPAFCNYFSELNHNEMNGWENPLGKFFVLILRDPDDHPQMLKRIKLTAALLKSKKIETEILDISGKTILEKIFDTTLLADWISYYLAQEYKVSPAELKLVENFKKQLKNAANGKNQNHNF
jgi:glucose/mannose-6-phosphate isomerase